MLTSSKIAAIFRGSHVYAESSKSKNAQTGFHFMCTKKSRQRACQNTQCNIEELYKKAMYRSSYVSPSKTSPRDGKCDQSISRALIYPHINLLR